MKRITLYQDRQGDKGLIIGFCQESHDGWRFFPTTCAHKPSRRAWPTWEKCIPRWVNHPNGTISDRAVETPLHRELDFTLDDLRAIDRALCIAAASYRDTGFTGERPGDWAQATQDSAKCRDLADRIGRHLASLEG